MTKENQYKDTLNLPNTAFPMKANLSQKEPKMLEKWQSNDLFGKIRAKSKGKTKFILHMGPPYANGDIHIGHAVTTVLKDIIVKYKSLRGYDAPLVPGWDCHGLPIEINVEKKIGLANVDVTPKEFRKACREYAHSQIDLQRKSFIRLGIIGDWQNPYMTMNHRYEGDVVRAIGKILAKGDIHKGAKPVHWCVNCASALAEAEVEYQNKTSPQIDVAFTVSNKAQFFEKIQKNDTDLKDIGVVIWTTTPWTLPANQGVALHPDLDYVLVKLPADAVVSAICVLEVLLPDVLKRMDISDVTKVATFKGKALEGLLLQHPFYDRKVPVVLGEHVTVDAGTGAVHTAPGHGLEDYQMGVQYHLPIETPVGDNGCFYPDTQLVGGLHVFKANDKILEILKENNKLLASSTLSHSYPHCWRHKTPLIFRATPQWFISMENNKLREKSLEAIKQVKWVPTWGESRLSLMVDGRPDWCISRQRTWGVPLPFLLHKETGMLHPQMTEIIEFVAKGMDETGIEAWYDLDIATLPFKDMDHYVKSKDVLDVWFESGVSHYCVLEARKDLQFPADIYLEGSDQHRGWFQSSLLSSVSMNNCAPYKTVITHGFTVDASGRKMSKSLGNVVAPEKVMNTLGADVLRLWVAATDYKGEIHVSDEILNRISDAYRRIRNTIRFLLANLAGFSPSTDLIDMKSCLALDQWIVDCMSSLQEEVLQAYEGYQFHLIYQKIQNFCIVELGSFYLDIIKDRQYTLKTNSHARRSAQTAMYLIVCALSKLIAPILSFTAEEIWENIPEVKETSVFLTEITDDLPKMGAHPMNNAFWQTMISVRNQVNKALEVQRTQGKIGAPLDAMVTLYASGELFNQLKLLGDELRFVLITSYADVIPYQQQSDAVATELADLWVSVKAADYEKCVRCWHHRVDVNKDPNYPDLCGRCVTNVDPNHEGENRQYA